MRSIIAAALILIGGLLHPAIVRADVISLKRGISLDIWVTWPEEGEMLKPGVLDIFPEWRRTVPMEKIAELKAAGFDFIRLPIEPSPFLTSNNETQSHLIDQTVETAKAINAAGLKVIIDLHAIPREGGKAGTDQIVNNPAMFEKHGKLVARMGKALSGLDPALVAFELLNEPNHQCDEIGSSGASPLWVKQLRTLHASARATAPKQTLILSGACWGGASGLGAIDPKIIADENIIWSFHSYEPFLASHQFASWTGGAESYFADLPFPPELVTDSMARKLVAEAGKRALANPKAAAKNLLRSNLRRALEDYRKNGREVLAQPFRDVDAWREKHGVPANRIILGEFGAIREDQGRIVTKPEWRAALMREIREQAEQRGFAWAVWSHGGSFGVTTDDNSRTPEPIMMKALGLSGG